jgi:HPt (histidine-containing phosphotransfer) domain-containing protein
LRELLEAFLHSARRQAAELNAASVAGDARQVGALAHKLKSSSRSVGALRLGDLCEDLEETGRAGDRGAVKDLIAPFQTELQRVIDQVEALLADGTSSIAR